ncbi:penicillin-binding transpeptidase domain-containing protein [Planococcus halotolerans]|uniref:penicillin-binding transpeptidase domain-containing protein n=1 Tax=Planococcus halotolerans TaxID=2233542 RepID=UPI001092A1AC|nr:penicillin-binding transpeptidase domain-containing protein [Planococcus halotolerans]QHJ72031.1 penicillin-binding transpeptidase domain-containing protein [Planococcus halotolerans]
MKKTIIGIFILAMAFFLSGCQEQVTPEDRLAEYIDHWNNLEFEEMYGQYLNEGTKAAYGTDEFVDRQLKLHEDLGIENLEVTFTEASEDTEWEEEQPADFPVQVTMDTLAGPVEFEENMTLLYEETEEAGNWFVEWTPSFIFPQLESGDPVRINRQSAARGELYDRNDQPLAVNGTGRSIGVVPEKFTNDADKEQLAELLGMSVDEINQQLNQDWVQNNLSQFVPFSKTSNDNTELLEQVLEIPGTMHQETAMREYPYGEALSHLIGYIGPVTAEQLTELQEQGYTENDMIGRQGLERQLEEQLRGEDGTRIYIDKEQEQITVAEKQAVNGEKIQLTIDAELQQVAYDSMAGEAGTSAAVDPETGETLVLLSSPGFNPSEFTLGVSGERYEELKEDPLMPLYNRFAQSYAPGSTIKPVTAAIGLEAGTLDPSEGLTIEGETWQKDDWDGYKVTRVHPEAPNPIDLNKALVYSDNIYFARQALEMGRSTLVEGLENFAFVEEIPYPLVLQSSQISNDGTIASEGQQADTSFGQGQMLANILHLASVYQPFLTDGVMHKPTLLLEEEDAQVWKDGLLSAENAEILRTDLRNVVVDGFAQEANLENIPLAGKTGTAELKAAGEESGQDNGFFIAYDSANPEFIIAMMVEDVGDNDGSAYVAGMVGETFAQFYE